MGILSTFQSNLLKNPALMKLSRHGKHLLRLMLSDNYRARRNIHCITCRKLTVRKRGVIVMRAMVCQRRLVAYASVQYSAISLWRYRTIPFAVRLGAAS